MLTTKKRKRKKKRQRVGLSNIKRNKVFEEKMPGGKESGAKLAGRKKRGGV